MRCVLAAIDTDESAPAVIAFAEQLARVLSAEVDCLHAGKPFGGMAGVEAAVRHIEGQPVSGIIDEAARGDVVAVVIGRRPKPREQPVGGVGAGLLAALPQPVAVIPADTPHPHRLGRVIVPLEGTRSSSLAPQRMIEIATGAGVDIVLLHVLDRDAVPMFTDRSGHEAEIWTNEFMARYCPVPPKRVHLQVRLGAVEEEVIRAARESDADLVALGWSRRLAQGRAPIVRAALEDAHLPVLLIPVMAADPLSAPGTAGVRMSAH